MQQQKQRVVCEWLELVTSIRCPLHSEILVGSGMRNKRFGYNRDVEIGCMSLFPVISLSLPLTGFVLEVLFCVTWAAHILQQDLSSRPRLNTCTRKLLVGITPSGRWWRGRCQGAWWAPRVKRSAEVCCPGKSLHKESWWLAMGHCSRDFSSMNLPDAFVSHCKLSAPTVCSPIRLVTTQVVVFSIFSVLPASSCPFPLRSLVKMTVSNPYLFCVTSFIVFATALGKFLHVHVCL